MYGIVCMYVCMCMCMYIYICIYIYVCMYIYIYVCMYVFIHLYMYILYNVMPPSCKFVCVSLLLHRFNKNPGYPSYTCTKLTMGHHLVITCIHVKS